MKLHIGKNYGGETAPVQSIFRLAGNDEDALTYALGYLMAYDRNFCIDLLRLFGVARPTTLDSTYSVHLQEVTDRKQKFGRRDIVVDAGERRIVVEAKIGGAAPTPDQLLKYASQDELWNQYKTRWIVTLTQVKLPASTKDQVRTALANKNIQFSAVQWYDVLRVALGHRPADSSEVSRYLFHEFIQYMRGDYEMGYFDAEVSIQDVDFLNSQIYKQGWMYVTAPKDKRAALYFAPYFARQGGNSGITMVSRVLCIENLTLDLASDDDAILDSALSVVRQDIDTYRHHWCLGLQEIRKRGKGEGWSKYECRLLFLDQPIQFRSKPLTKKDLKINNQIPKGFSLTFQELLGAPG